MVSSKDDYKMIFFDDISADNPLNIDCWEVSGAFASLIKKFYKSGMSVDYMDIRLDSASSAQRL